VFGAINPVVVDCAVNAVVAACAPYVVAFSMIRYPLVSFSKNIWPCPAKSVYA
jgi:hypothetical protein